VDPVRPASETATAGFLPLFYIGERLAASGMGGMVLLYPSAGPLARKVAAFRDILIASIKSHGME
jgi:hypothetical protein